MIDNIGVTKTNLEIPADMSLSKLIPTLVSTLGLPTQKDNSSIIYHLHNLNGFQLMEKHTLTENGVVCGDTLELKTEIEYHGTKLTIVKIQSTVPLRLNQPPLLQEDRLTNVGLPENEKVQLLVGPQTFQNISLHIRHDTSNEVGGFLIGNPYNWKDKIHVEIIDSISAIASYSSSVHLAISPETWPKVFGILKEKYPESYVVGWYHTHPGMQTFMSSQDVFMQECFFSEIWHVALVLEPITRKADFFIWDNGHIRRSSGYRVCYPIDVSIDETWESESLFG